MLQCRQPVRERRQTPRPRDACLRTFRFELVDAFIFAFDLGFEPINVVGELIETLTDGLERWVVASMPGDLTWRIRTDGRTEPVYESLCEEDSEAAQARTAYRCLLLIF